MVKGKKQRNVTMIPTKEFLEFMATKFNTTPEAIENAWLEYHETQAHSVRFGEVVKETQTTIYV